LWKYGRQVSDPAITLQAADVPQADVLRRIVALVTHVVAGTDPHKTFPHQRDLHYYKTASRVLGLLNEHDAPTPTGFALVTMTPPAQLRMLADGFARSTCGRAWLAWANAANLDALNVSKAAAFLLACSPLRGRTLARRARTLRQWVRQFRGKSWSDTKAPVPDKKPRQLSLAELGPDPAWKERPRDWPDTQRFPHNEAKAAVGKVVLPDLAVSDKILIIIGFAALDKVIDLLAERSERPGPQQIRILFGNEPFPPVSKWSAVATKPLDDQIRDYWLQQGISPSPAAVIRARELISQGIASVRIRRRLHAKIYASVSTVSLGSSNFTEPGLRTQSEGNVRFDSSEERRREETRLLAESLWEGGKDYRDGLIALLDKLLHAVTWREALARAASCILEGDWAKHYVPARDVEEQARHLWPHQRQGIAQALWILENVGSVLVADATGSGKTLMGSWIIRGAYDQQHRKGYFRRVAPVILAPPGVVTNWENDLREAGHALQVDSPGPLSNEAAIKHRRILKAVADADVLAADEAHRYVNRSARTNRLLAHYADQVLLFTATPINRGEQDLLGMIELLGADNLSDEALELFARRRKRLRHRDRIETPEELERIRLEIQRFMVRRTRKQLNKIVDRDPESYRLPSGRIARYPHHHPKYYKCDATEEDLAIAREIESLASELTGIARIGKKLQLSALLTRMGLAEEDYVSRLIGSARALARYTVLDCLRSSRAALYEHVFGTERALAQFHITNVRGGKAPTGNVVELLTQLAGQPPEWRLETVEKDAVPSWLWDPVAHRKECERDQARYERIGTLAAQLSETRERHKAELVQSLANRKGVVLAFDFHLISLAVMHHLVAAAGVPCDVFTGQRGKSARRQAEDVAGPNARSQPFVMLCSDALSESLNLQGSSCVVHLDTPTVIRTAEQRAGRVDRMNTRHDDVEVWWPRDPPGFAPRKRDHLHERHRLVREWIGANLELPRDPADDDVELNITELAEEVNLDRPEVKDTRDLYDAFRPIRLLIGEGGMITDEQYEKIRTSKAEVLCRVSVVRSARPWAFAAVGGRDRIAPRWVFLTDLEARPVSDLYVVADLLRIHLASNPPSLPPKDRRGDEWVQRFVHRLQACEAELLSPRRQRALDLAVRVLHEYHDRAWEGGDRARHERMESLLGIVEPNLHEAHPDLASVAEAWVRLIRPRIQDALKMRPRRRKPWTLRELEGPLLEQPLLDEQLVKAFDEIAIVPPLGARIVAMIVGVPDESNGSAA
jgi:hypothetical protein